MYDKKDFENMKKQLTSYDDEREKLIKRGRDVIKLSKLIIFQVHRNELSTIEPSVKSITDAVSDLDKQVKQTPSLYYEGSYKAAIMEYVEALLLYHFVKDGKILSRKSLKVDTNYYLLGLCDLPGELARKAIVDATKGEVDSIFKIREAVDTIYGLVSMLDIRGGELRKKFDSIKYDLKRLDDVCFELKMKR